MKIYIAGKITGDAKYKEKFASEAKAIEDAGHIPLNPAMLPAGMKNEDYMRICFAMIDISDAVYFLPDALESKGAMLEYDYCDYTYKPRFYLEDIGGQHEEHS